MDENDSNSNYDPSKFSTKNTLSKYERVALIGNRAEQLRRNAQSTIKIDPNVKFDPIKIAKEELQQHKIPFMISRSLPDGTKEVRKVSDMEIQQRGSRN